MKINYLFITLILLISCTNKKEIDIETYDRLISTIVNINEQTLDLNKDIINNINGLNIKLVFLKMDPYSTKTAKKVIPISNKIKKMTNSIDDLFLNSINLLIEREGGKSNWFTKNTYSQQTDYYPLYELNNFESTKWTTELFGVNSKQSIDRAEEFRLSLLKFRDQLILAVADSVIDDKNQLKIITIDNLNNYKTFKDYLERTKHPDKFGLLSIFDELTITEKIMFSDVEILWNKKYFHKQPMIGVIANLNYTRNRIRKSQEMATKMLLSRVDKPLKPLIEYQK